MHQLSVHKIKSDLAFIEEAATFFRINQSHTSYTSDEIASGELLALRWNNDCILVVKIDDNHNPIIFELETPLS